MEKALFTCARDMGRVRLSREGNSDGDDDGDELRRAPEEGGVLIVSCSPAPVNKD